MPLSNILTNKTIKYNLFSEFYPMNKLFYAHFFLNCELSHHNNVLLLTIQYVISSAARGAQHRRAKKVIPARRVRIEVELERKLLEPIMPCFYRTRSSSWFPISRSHENKQDKIIYNNVNLNKLLSVLPQRTCICNSQPSNLCTFQIQSSYLTMFLLHIDSIVRIFWRQKILIHNAIPIFRMVFSRSRENHT